MPETPLVCIFSLGGGRGAVLLGECVLEPLLDERDVLLSRVEGLLARLRLGEDLEVEALARFALAGERDVGVEELVDEG